MSGADSEFHDDNSCKDELINDNEKNESMHPAAPALQSPPPLYSTDDYKIDGM